MWAFLDGYLKLGKWSNSLLWQSFVRSSHRAQFHTAGACTTVQDRQEALAAFIVAQVEDLALDVQEAQVLFSSDLQPGKALEELALTTPRALAVAMRFRIIGEDWPWDAVQYFCGSQSLAPPWTSSSSPRPFWRSPSRACRW